MFKPLIVAFVLLFTNSFAFAKTPVTHGVYNLHKVTESIYRGGRATAEGMEYLASLGTKTIINLEFDEEAVAFDRAEAKKNGIKFLHRPMQYKTPPTDAQVDELLALLQDSKNFPIYIHCAHGKDRTGIVVGIYNVEVQGWTAKRAYDDMMAKGFARFHRALETYFKRRVELKQNRAA